MPGFASTQVQQEEGLPEAPALPEQKVGRTALQLSLPFFTIKKGIKVNAVRLSKRGFEITWSAARLESKIARRRRAYRYTVAGAYKRKVNKV